MINFFKNRYELHYRGSKFHLVADIIFAVVIVTLLVIFLSLLFWKPKPYIDLRVEKVGGDYISGSAVDFLVSYKNNKKATADSLKLDLPTNFILSGVEPAADYNAQTQIFKLSDLKANSSGSFKISGRLIGALDQEQIMSAKFDCTECGFGVLGAAIYKIKASNLGLNLQMPSPVYEGVETPGKLVIKNNGDFDFSNIKLKPSLGWKLASGDFVLQNNQLVLDKLAAGQEKTINFTIIRQAETDADGDTIPLTMSASLGVGSADLLQAEAKTEINLKVPRFMIKAVPAVSAVGADEALAYKIDFINQEEETLSDVNFKIFSGNEDFTVKSVDWTNYNLAAKVGDQALILKNPLSKNAGGSVNVTVLSERQKIKPNTEFKIDILVEYKLNGQLLKYHVLSEPVKILSTLSVKAGAYYYSAEGDQIGVGPLPPEVDMATKYWVFFQVDNNGNDLENLTLSADLSDSAVWTDRRNILAGDLSHGEIGGRVLWTLDDVNRDPNWSKYKAGFEIGIIPESGDIGQILPLLKNISYKAFDKFANQEISGNLKSLDTNLSADPLANNKGRVVPAAVLE